MTAIWIVALLEPEVAVTVIVRFWELVPALNVAIAVPVASVVACVTVSAPEFAVKLTVAPGTTLLFASTSNALMVAGEAPAAEGICGTLVLSVRVC
jgi:hypothetical protein